VEQYFGCLPRFNVKLIKHDGCSDQNVHKFLLIVNHYIEELLNFLPYNGFNPLFLKEVGRLFDLKHLFLNVSVQEPSPEFIHNLSEGVMFKLEMLM